MDKSAIESLLARSDVYLLIFGIIVVVGVAGESFFGIRHRWNSRKLQAIQQVEELKQQEELAKLHSEAEAARTLAESFRLDIAKANEQAARSNQIAEQERLARMQLEAKLQPRSFTPEQAQKMVDSLKRFAGTRADLIKIGDATELTRFATLIQGILNAAGWNLAGPWSTMGGVSGSGVFVGARAGADAAVTAATDALVSEITTTGNVVTRIPEFTDKDTPGALMGPPWDASKMAPVRIYVGDKP